MWARQFECLWNNLSGPPKHACILCGKTGHAKGACVVLGAVLHRKLNSSRDVVEIILRMLCDWSEVHYGHQITCLRYRPGGMYIQMYMYMHVFIHIYIHTYIYTCIYIYTYICMFIHIYVCICILYTCVYIYMFVARRHTAPYRFCCSSLSQKERIAHLGFEMSERTRDEKCIQGGEDSQDPLSCRSFSTKEPLNIGLFCGK